MPEGEGDWRGFRGANFAEGDGRLDGESEGRRDGESSGSTLCRGEIKWGTTLDFGETEAFGDSEGLGDGVSEGAVAAWDELRGVAVSVAAGVGLSLEVVVFEVQLINEFSMSFCNCSAVNTSPPLNFPRLLLAGRVAVGVCPIGIGS